jgi:GAF domain-containing protein
MPKAPLPKNETERLAALYRLEILDTPAEERFDRITRIAAELFDVPISYVALLDDDRQWFKSSCGLNVSETPRDVSFCSYAINENQPLVILDAREDERFRDLPIVTGDPHIRFYAGCPLAVPKQLNVGTLCVGNRSQRSDHVLGSRVGVGRFCCLWVTASVIQPRAWRPRRRQVSMTDITTASVLLPERDSVPKLSLRKITA